MDRRFEEAQAGLRFRGHDPRASRRRCAEELPGRVRDVYKAEFPDVARSSAFQTMPSPSTRPIICGQNALGERSNHGPGRKPAVRNIFLDDASLGVKALQARGVFGGATSRSTASRSSSAQAAAAGGGVRADLLAGLNWRAPRPSHVMALGSCRTRRHLRKI